jgi:calcium-dependent protein kinase
MSEYAAARVTSQTLLALKHLHANGICHRDLKPENIMFLNKQTDTIKLIDFGLSKKLNTSSNLLERQNSVVGTPYYVAPEVLTMDYDFRCDIWSVGVILFIMLSGYPPFNGKSTREVIQ